MKKHVAILAGLLALALVGTASAAKKNVNVTGDLTRDGFLTVDIDWTVDTAKYPGKDQMAIREAVRGEMWEKMLPQLVNKTHGKPVSFEGPRLVAILDFVEIVDAVRIVYATPSEAATPPVPAHTALSLPLLL